MEKLVNILQKITTSGESIVGVYDSDYTLPNDGWFRIYDIYLTDGKYSYNNNKFYKEGNPVTTEEILEINTKTTNFRKECHEVFNTSALESCLLELNSLELTTCNDSKKDPCTSNNCKRNHVEHILNILNYYIECGNTEEALRLLEEVTSCLNLCVNKVSCHCVKPCKCDG